MTDTVVLAEDHAESTGFRFSWGLAIAGGVAATAVTFFLLSLGSGFGLLLVNPVSHSGPSMPTFLTGGAIYFLIAQAFGFAVGGHIAGRLIGRLTESKLQEDFRAEAHGLIVWAVAVLATLTVVTMAGLSAASTGATTAALYGFSGFKAQPTPAAYLVDILFRPEAPATTSTARRAMIVSEPAPSSGARAEAERIVDASLALGLQPTADDHGRLIDLVSANAAISIDAATHRVDAMQASQRLKMERAANIARKAASYTALWIALSLLFGAIVSTTAAVVAREEDDRESIR